MAYDALRTIMPIAGWPEEGLARSRSASATRPGPVPAVLFARIPGRGRKRCGPAPFQRLQPVKRGQHRLAVVHVARQASFAKGLTEVAGVRGEHDLTAIKPQPKGLVPRRVPVRRQTHH
jgi:hypothetical protein